MAAPKTLPLFYGVAGLNTQIDPERLQQGIRENGYTVELAQAVNISIDDRGQVSLRNGSTSEIAGSFHSVFCDGGDCFAIRENTSDASIVRINADFSVTVVRSGLAKNLRMEWGQANADTFYSNGTQFGYIRSGTSYAWPVGAYRGPDADIQFASVVPAANHFAFLQNNNKCALAVGSSLVLNHLPFQYGLYAPALGTYGFESNVLMVFGVQGGFFVSDDHQIWFFRKLETGWYNYRQERVADYPALEWSLAHDRVDMKDTIGEQATGFGRVFATTDGICLGTDGGTLINLTNEKIKYPSGYGSGACLVRDDTVIHTAW